MSMHRRHVKVGRFPMPIETFVINMGNTQRNIKVEDRLLTICIWKEEEDINHDELVR